ncbi:outer membrane lipoprotein carrier protein LolA [Xylophilus sp. GOD-11R]|uniref:outer membrane lipoprotein carrier protein LolA n=1 Tax=Xylophilus sp. GOD-11R TaxID=3089814 RepID=UPI00298C81CC|nr:outer membrane lipoprotein carrier protein LolA [Xylophilus sp. GOD-11R]WPB57079.1 outer membrane lipoprotein carrier protein LolA [Xylophilus sp. GOD-11R]
MSWNRRRWMGGLAAIVSAAPAAMAFAESASSSPGTSALVAGVRSRLVAEPVLRGLFEQQKRVTGFRHPLVSRGDFLVLRDRGVFWHTREPFESTLVVSRDRLVSRRADGSIATQLDGRDEPAIRALNETLFALVSADLAALTGRFVIEGTLAGAEGWSLDLRPRDAGLARFVTRVGLTGDRFVRSVTLAEAQGDSSVIQFSQQVAASRANADELARFD